MNINKYIYLFTALCLYTSCIKEDIKPCPPLHINIEVKDKNYFNISSVNNEYYKNENLPFRAYIPTLYYTLSELNTGKVIVQKNVFNVTGDEKVYPITFQDDIPLGKYVLTVWGGLSDDIPLKDDPYKVELHLGNKEGDDIYLSNDTIDYTPHSYNYTIDMERTKGQLVVQMVNLPRSTNHSDMIIDGLFKRTDRYFNYSETTSVYNQYKWEAATETVTKTVLAPSIKERNSLLKLNFYADSQYNLPILTPKGINITMKRNELTVLKYVYDSNGEFMIYMLVEDNWEQQHGLVIN